MTDCVSLEMAFRLKLAGWVQDDGGYWIVDDIKQTSTVKDSRLMRGECFSTCHRAPTIGELLEALPDRSSVAKAGSEDFNAWHYGYEEGKDEGIQHASNPADALAFLWIALKEKNLL